VGLSNRSTPYVNLKPGLEGFLYPEIKKMKNENKKTTTTTLMMVVVVVVGGCGDGGGDDDVQLCGKSHW